MRRVVLVLILLCAVRALPQAVPLPPAPVKYVTDAAGVIADNRELALNEKLAEHERATTNQVIVYIDRALPPGTTLEVMSTAAIRAWGVGQKKLDNGVILFLFLDSRDSRIEVGYGLEGVLTDAIAKEILVGMRPLLRNGDYAGAVEQGATAILNTIDAPADAREPWRLVSRQPITSTPRPVRPSYWMLPMAVVGVGVIVVMLLAELRSRKRRTSSPNNNDGRPRWPSTSGNTWSAGAPTWTSSDSSSPSSSGFTGGGGGGGGGGASDKW